MSPDPLEMMLRAFRLPTMAQIYARTLEQAEQQNWGYRKFLQHLCESETQDPPGTARGAIAQALGPARGQDPGEPG
jgi:DNA replication protein DnaC